jgi:hypothetical protein
MQKFFLKTMQAARRRTIGLQICSVKQKNAGPLKRSGGKSEGIYA